MSIYSNYHFPPKALLAIGDTRELSMLVKLGAGLKYMYTLLSSLGIINSREPAAGFLSDYVLASVVNSSM